MNLERNFNALKQLPAPGCGFHTSQLSVANLGTIANKPAQEIFESIRQYIPVGSRRLSDREIIETINKAMADYTGGTFTPRPASLVQNGKVALQRIIDQNDFDDEAALWEISPTRQLDKPYE